MELMEQIATRKVTGKIPPFTGKENLMEWLGRFELLCRLNKWKDESLILHLYENLAGDALEWFADLPIQKTQNFKTVLKQMWKDYGQTGKNYSDFRTLSF